MNEVLHIALVYFQLASTQHQLTSMNTGHYPHPGQSAPVVNTHTVIHQTGGNTLHISEPTSILIFSY